MSSINVVAITKPSPMLYRGYNYNNIKICDADFSWSKYPAQFQIDMGDIKSGGANFIRLYYQPGMDKTVLDQHMTMAQQNGLKIMMLFWVNYNQDYSKASGKDNRTKVINDYVSAVQNIKDYSTVAAIGFGSENNYFLGPNTSKDDWFSLVNEATRAAKLTGATQKFYTSNGEIGDLVKYQKMMPSLDWFGATIYRPDRQAILAINQQYSRVNKPLLITEYGKDSLTYNQEDQEGQSKILLEFTEAFESLDKIVGVTIFQYEDNWNKIGDPCIQDNGHFAQLGSISANADRLDGIMSEEWLGVTKQINRDQTMPRPKKQAFYTILRYWNGQ
ncbi:MAG: hypothetical protein OHK0017_06370 [Patescibacteria group bacterium]